MSYQHDNALSEMLKWNPSLTKSDALHILAEIDDLILKKFIKYKFVGIPYVGLIYTRGFGREGTITFQPCTKYPRYRKKSSILNKLLKSKQRGI